MHSFVWDAKDRNGHPVASGTYHLRMTVLGSGTAPKVFRTTLTRMRR
jgi:flagellar hook assembly protein FlgD